MKKIKIYVIMMIIIIISLVGIPNASNASVLGDIIDKGDSFIKAGEKIRDHDGDKEDDIQIAQGSLKEFSKYLYNVLFYIGTIASVLVGSILGIQIMLASAEEKAKVKERLIPYIIGCFVIFGAFSMWKLAVNIFTQIG